MARFKKAPNGQWPGYPHLRLEDIETLTIRQNHYVAKALVNNRKGRLVLLLDQELHQKFLNTVKERKGDISARHVNESVVEAVQTWIKKKSK